MRIELLYFKGCPTYISAHEQLKQALGEEGLDLPVEMIEVETPENAQELRFLGSPSIRINGLDVDKSARQSMDYGIMCRVYVTESGMSGYPSVNTIREAIREANHKMRDDEHG